MTGVKTVLFWIVVGVAVLVFFQVVRTPANEHSPEISYSQFLSEANAGKIASVVIEDRRIHGQYRDGKGSFRLTGPNNPAVFLDLLSEKGVEIWFKNSGNESSPLNLLGTWAPVILLGALWFFMVRQIQRRTTSVGPDGSPGQRGL